MRENLIELMKEYRFTCSSLAKNVGIDRTTVSHIKQGRGTNVEIALAIAKALNTTVENIFLSKNELNASKCDDCKQQIKGVIL